MFETLLRKYLGRTQASTRAALFVLVLVSLIQYSYSFGNGFVWDAGPVFLEDYTIRDASYLRDYFTKDFLAFMPSDGAEKHLLYYRPLVKLIHLAEYRVFGPSPHGYNAVNIVANAMAVAMAFLLVLAIVNDRTVAFFAALLYAVHPARVEAVSWSYSDSYVFVGLLCYASLYMYANGRRLSSLLIYILALFTHETAVLAALGYFAYEALAVDAVRPRNFLRAVPFAAATACFLVIRSMAVGSIPVSELPILTKLNTAAVVTMMYLRSSIFPEAPIVMYPLRLYPEASPLVLFSYAVTLAALALGVVLVIRRRRLAFWYVFSSCVSRSALMSAPSRSF